MLLTEREVPLPKAFEHESLLDYFRRQIALSHGDDEEVVRFVVTKTDDDGYHCEVGVLSHIGARYRWPAGSVFDFQRRPYESAEGFNVVLLVPTGIGAELGGHSGDAGPVARLLAGCCDNLITHPNVMNAADINELPDNALYVEGSVITRLLMGTVALQKVRSNRVALVVDQHTDKMFHELAINSASAARAGLGLDCPIVIKMENRTSMKALYSKSGRAAGRIEHLERLCEVLEKHREEYDAVALSTLIDVQNTITASIFFGQRRRSRPAGR